MRVIAELNDSNITVATISRIIAMSPGVAIIRDDTIELGQAAADKLHLYPQNAHTRFWSELNLDRLKITSGLARHHADLAFAHIGLIHELAGKPEELVLAVPGSFSEKQLSLLAGLLEAAPFQVTSLVDTAVAAIASHPIAGHCQYVDIVLHQIVITTVEVTDRVRLITTQVLDDTGLSAVYDNCAQVIADLFIAQSRFDPLHHAETEQRLYDRLPHCLQSLTQQDETVFVIDYQQTPHQAKVKQQALAAALAGMCDKLNAVLNPDMTTVLNNRVALIPGLQTQLDGAVVLDSHAVFAGACLFPLPAADDSHVNFVTEIPLDTAAAPVRTTASTPAPSQPTASPPAATHLLIAHEAHPVTDRPLYLHLNNNSLALSDKKAATNCVFQQRQGSIQLACDAAADITINGQMVTGNHRLVCGDMIQTVAGQITAIRIKDEHEPT